MASTVSGTLTLSSTLNVAVPVGPTALTAYNIGIAPNLTNSYAAGSGPNQGNKIYQSSLTATGAVADLDLTAAVCVDGTVGFTHVRELWIFNDATTVGYTLTYGLGTNPFSPMLGGTTPTVVISPGSVQRFYRPLDTLGWTVSGSIKTVRVDPGANTIAYRIIVLGD